MLYTPSNVPADAGSLPAFLQQELLNLQRALAQPVPSMRLQTLYAEPPRIAEGDVVLADGADWNPGSGQGVYTYYGAAWHKLG